MTDAKVLHVHAPGRTELAGNHTDHQRGMVMAATVDLGIDCFATPNGTDTVNVTSEGFPEVYVQLSDLAPREEEKFTSAALTRGVLAGLQSQGVEPVGFDVRVESQLVSGGGFSSSAAFALGIGLCTVKLAGAELSPERLALAAHTAEADYFGKPCGLMDQMAIACGGVIAIDFAQEGAEPGLPLIEKIDFPQEDTDLDIVLVDVGASHADCEDLYADITEDMKAVAHLCGGEVLSDISEMEMMQHFAQIREELGDKTLLRAWHYFREMNLTDVRVRALKDGEIDEFLAATRASGNSSAQYLQNISDGGKDQPAMVALALAEHLIGTQGACRIHGGGFGGSIQAFMPHMASRGFIRSMELFLGPGCCTPVTIDPLGVRVVDDETTVE